MPDTPIRHLTIRTTTRSTVCSATPVPGCAPRPRSTICRRAAAIDGRGTPRRWIVPVAIVTATAAAVVAAVWLAGPATDTVREAPADTGRRLDARLGSRFAASGGARRIERANRDGNRTRRLPPRRRPTGRGDGVDHRGRLRPCGRHVRAISSPGRQRRRRMPHASSVAGHPHVDRGPRRAGVRGRCRRFDPDSHAITMIDDRRSISAVMARLRSCRPAGRTCPVPPITSGSVASRRLPDGTPTCSSCRRAPGNRSPLEPIASSLPDGLVAYRRHGRDRRDADGLPRDRLVPRSVA